MAREEPQALQLKNSTAEAHEAVQLINSNLKKASCAKILGCYNLGPYQYLYDVTLELLTRGPSSQYASFKLHELDGVIQDVYFVSPTDTSVAQG